MENTSEGKNKIYRLTLLDDSSHKRIKSVRFSKLGLIVTLVTAVVLIVVMVYCLIAFTPVRTMIPGYPDARSRKQAIENAIKIDSLESVIIRWELYSENLSRVLTGEQAISLDSIARGSKTKYLKNVSSDVIAEQDSLLRLKFKDE